MALPAQELFNLHEAVETNNVAFLKTWRNGHTVEQWNTLIGPQDNPYKYA